MTTVQITTLLIFHGVFDWYLQDRETAKNKSRKLSYLLPHLFILTLGLLVWSRVFSGLNYAQGISWVMFNVIAHGLIDWNLFKVYKYIVINRKEHKGIDLSITAVQNTFPYWEDKTFYDFIMLDQLLHGLCYVLSYAMFKEFLY